MNTGRFLDPPDPFNDLAPDLQAQTFSQSRKLTNAGLRSDISYVKGIHNVKTGVTYEHTFLTEDDKIGIVDPTYLSLFNELDASGNAISGTSCMDGTGKPIAVPCTILAPFDLTRGGGLAFFHGHTDVKEIALYVQDTITKGSWSFNLGIQGETFTGESVMPLSRSHGLVLPTTLNRPIRCFGFPTRAH